MTNYAGETYVIVQSARDEDNTRDLTNTDVTSVQVVVYNRDFTETLVDDPMSWDSTHGDWRYVWNTAGLSAGTYRAKVTLVGPLDGEESIEWLRIRLARQPNG